MADAAVLTPAVPKPAHVPDSAVYDFDLFFDPAYVANPHERILDLHQKAPPIFWTPRQGGLWMAISHAAVFNASRDWESFSSEFVSQETIKAMQATLPAGTHIPQMFPISLDPPEHGQYRAPLQGVFSPKSTLALKDDIRALADRLIDKIKDQGRCELMADIAEPLPVQVFLKMFGLPLERQDEYRALVRKHLLRPPAADSASEMLKMQEITAAMRDTIIERRDNPQNDILSMLWKSQVDGRPTTQGDIENYALLLFIAGLDTVMNGIGFGVRHLAEDLSLQDTLRKNPELIQDAKEELLRRYTFSMVIRRVTKDMVFEGVELKENDRIVLFLPGADLDAKEFPNPERFDLHRENRVHIAFNAGPHRCLGSHLARMELQILYEQMLSRLPPFRLDPQHPPTFHCAFVCGVDTLHLVWDK